jgi:hypothetical protein
MNNKEEGTGKVNDNYLRFYKFSYLIKVNGGLSLFSFKRDKSLYISIILGIIASYWICQSKKITALSLINFMSVSSVSSITLLGLIIVSFAIIATSLNDKELIKKLVESGNYAYFIFSFTWAGIWAIVSSFLSMVSLIFSLEMLLFPIEVFAISYAILNAFSLVYFSLRQIAIMNTRYEEEMREAWNKFEKTLLDNKD